MVLLVFQLLCICFPDVAAVIANTAISVVAINFCRLVKLLPTKSGPPCKAYLGRFSGIGD